mmetsp:Transcript_29325/g.82718  ORF Transcript_29325/g.82718 Transcript_29325/m.82718 type:complete len:206 (+) Transcript_29325:257-874(+)
MAQIATASASSAQPRTRMPSLGASRRRGLSLLQGCRLCRRTPTTQVAAGSGDNKGPKMQELPNTVFPSSNGATPPSTIGEATKPIYAPRPMIKSKTVSLFDAMKFSGPAPEIVNGRLAMVGFLAAAMNEVTTGDTVEKQILEAPVTVGVFVLVVVYASLVPIMKGVKNEAFGFMSPRAETTNGRAAMLAFAVMVALELRTGIPFF